MSRIKIDLPESFSFEFTMPVRITDVNYGGHVGNDKYFSFLHEARMAWLAQHGYTELSFEGTGLILSQAIIEYKKELNYGDTIRVQVQAANPGKYGFDIYYCMLLQTNDQPVIAAKAMTTMLCYDYSQKRLVSLSATVQNHLFNK